MSKSYHTKIVINASPEIVWKELTNFAEYPDWNPIIKYIKGSVQEGNKIKVHLIPLKSTLSVRLINIVPNRELRWTGGVPKVTTGNHYYILEPLESGTKTLLRHGEHFTGLFSFMIPSFVIKKMEKLFNEHNEILKQRVEALVLQD
ncbi:MAG: SRPBCC domain-containing protein [Saprospiraceae bacterium]|nr:SRPBCC domain-containing protein [Saprospiraceae bacterium]